MLVKCHEHLHPLIRLDRNCVDQNIFQQDYNQDIFEQTTSISEPIEQLVKRELLVLGDINWMLMASNVLFNSSINIKQCFLQLDFQLDKFWVLLDLKLKHKDFFSLVGIFTNLRRCCLQTKNLKKLIFVNKNWPNVLEQVISLHLTYWNSLKGIRSKRRV